MNPDFQDYLQSVCHIYQRWWEQYTITDVQGHKPSSQFDFGFSLSQTRQMMNYLKI